MQPDPNIKVGSVVAAIPGNPMSTRWVVQEIRNGYGGITWYGRGLGAVFPEPINTNELRPPELLYDTASSAFAAFSAQSPRLAQQIRWLTDPTVTRSYDELHRMNREWAEPAKALAQPPLTAVIPDDIADAIAKAGYQIDRMDYAAEGDTIWLRDTPYTLGGANHAVGILALIVKPVEPVQTRLKGELYIECSRTFRDLFNVGFTPEHYLLLSRDEVIAVIEQLAERISYVKGHP